MSPFHFALVTFGGGFAAIVLSALCRRVCRLLDAEMEARRLQGTVLAFRRDVDKSNGRAELAERELAEARAEIRTLRETMSLKDCNHCGHGSW